MHLCAPWVKSDDQILHTGSDARAHTGPDSQPLVSARIAVLLLIFL